MLSMYKMYATVGVDPESYGEGETIPEAAVIGWVQGNEGKVLPIVNWKGKARVLQEYQYSLLSVVHKRTWEEFMTINSED